MNNENNMDDHIAEITKEFRDGFEILKKYPKSVTIFGSSRLSPVDPYYKQAQELAGLIVKELGYSVISGGGPGIMAGANFGAKEAGGNSIGFAINLPREQKINPYVTSAMEFKYFLSRKAMLTFSAEAFICFPGGYGTFDELFSVLTLIQNKKIPRVPIILIGQDFWNDLKDFMVSKMLGKVQSIDKSDLDLFMITDDLNKVIEIIKKAPISEWWKDMD
ncbi:MAG: TIGR00730 family Rossman fold protein [Patescibacteria group bacterium]